jgi:hypothetical protein
MALRTPELEKEKDLGASGDVLPAKDVESSNAYDDEDDGEVFKKNVDGLEYRTVGWLVLAGYLPENATDLHH